MKLALFLLAYLCIATVDGKVSCGSTYRKEKYQLYALQKDSHEQRDVKKFFKSTGSSCDKKCNKQIYRETLYSFSFRACITECCFKKLEEGKRKYGKHHHKVK
ncbi:hypothetical protein D918_02595 [Trichuris suis]|nr:hypothetical protein D918_02595 [Trichuris suis]